MKPILEIPRNAYVESEVSQCALLIDCRNYYRALCRAMELAQRYVVISGWQFESGVRLLRGEDAETSKHPVKFLDFMTALCEARPDLHIYLLAWDFSVVYASDREPHQKEKFNATSSRIHFEWDPHPSLGGSHHQKFAVIDGAIGFIGGIDICDARWDDCDHRPHHPDRVNVTGGPCKPYHDVQACFTGAIVEPLVQIFCDRWGRATDQHLELPPAEFDAAACFDVMQLSEGKAEPIAAQRAALSRTQVDSRAEPERIGEILNLFADAISSAEHSIYIETQYFTSRSVAQALIARMQDESRPTLDIVVFLPHGADTAMEKMALEDTQEGVLNSVLDSAQQNGHRIRLLYPASHNPEGEEIATFIHSKILIVDDRLLMVGSPNCTERSMGLDSELAITWECKADDGLASSIRNIRTKLLAEHSGLPESDFADQSLLCQKLDWLMEHQPTRLRRREVIEPGPLGPLLAELFDPGDADLSNAALPQQ
ncbi:MAG TPA: phospholipase D-like domain-containing protein [Polyangiaceae bacterium]|nr:phospholipase D-like domain-containing protein [Polyangiaceae bacterium]